MPNAIFKRRRRDIFVERRPEQVSSSVRSGMVAVRKDRPYGTWAFVAGGFTRMSPLPGLELAGAKPLTCRASLPRRNTMKVKAQSLNAGWKRLGFSLDAGYPAEAGG
jgi:hypothetical protein